MQMADLQDHLLAVGHDLERLRTLLSESCELLLRGFDHANEALGGIDKRHAPEAIEALRASLQGAVVALQFEDMANQLLRHTQTRVQSCADRLAAQAFGDDDEDGAAQITPPPSRPNPVTQDEMDAGSVELF